MDFSDLVLCTNVWTTEVTHAMRKQVPKVQCQTQGLTTVHMGDLRIRGTWVDNSQLGVCHDRIFYDRFSVKSVLAIAFETGSENIDFHPAYPVLPARISSVGHDRDLVSRHQSPHPCAALRVRCFHIP